MLKQRVFVGLTAWAAWGDTGWRCVRVLSVGRKFVKVQREHPRSGGVVARKGKALIGELVPRDPRKRGRDKPAVPPAIMFNEQRALARVVEPELVVSEPEPERAPPPEQTPERKALMAALLEELGSCDW